MNALASFVGFRFFERDGRGRFELRLSWAEISGGFGLAFGLCLFDEHYSLHIRLGWPNIYLRLPIPRRWVRDVRLGEGMESWGVTFFERSIHLNWGHRCKIIHLPWEYTWVRTSYLLNDGTWHVEHRNDRRKLGGFKSYEATRKLRDERGWKESYPYRYVLRSGEIQTRTATIDVGESEHRFRWLVWLPFFGRVYRGIGVSFDDEVGERTGSWKGGTLGCSYHMLPGENPLACLRRMEAERKF